MSQRELASILGTPPGRGNPPVIEVPESDGKVPRRYPSRVRVSAVQDLPNGCGKDASTNSSKKDSSITKRTRGEQVTADDDEVAEVNNVDQGCNALVEKTDKTRNKDSSFIKRKRGEEVTTDENEVVETNKIDQGCNALVGKEDIGECLEEVVTRKRVREALRVFQTIYRKLLQQEESKMKDPGRGMRVVTKAYQLFKEKNELISGRKYLGIVPGVEVGDEFHFRVELALTNLHRQYPGCIDFMQHTNGNVAVSIVWCGSYKSYMNSSNILLFYGSGARTEDQKFDHANLALKNSIDMKIAVRVIRGFEGHEAGHSPGEKGKKFTTYVYDGLYTGERYFRKRGKNGHLICMFKLKRLAGQPELAIKTLDRKLIRSRALSGPYIEDLSQGVEKLPVSVVNTIDDEQPLAFKYTSKIIYPLGYQPTPPNGCDCVNGCSDSEKCACAVKNGGEIPFNFSGAIVEAKPLVYECGPSCKCPPSCHNRVSQHGIKFPLEVFKTEKMGWGVRSLTSIPSGSFICEYAGELLEDEEAQKRTTDEYLFAIGNNYYDEALWEGLSTFVPDLQKTASCKIVEDGGYTIDASEYGNVGRFINHNCTPNLYAQNLLYDHDDKSKPHIVLFAAENIPPLQELTYHYNYTMDDVHDSEGNIKIKKCHCGSAECTGRLY